jgi:glycosyltransferase involved in cell wall biosynthesis
MPSIYEKSKVYVHHTKCPIEWLNPLVPPMLNRIIHKVKPDVIHSGFLQSYGFYAALVNHHPLLSMPWGSDVLVYPKSPLYGWITRFTLSRADMITCDCRRMKSEILRLVDFPEVRIVVFPWGIDLAKFNPLKIDPEIREQLGWEDNLVVIHDRMFEKIYGPEYLVDAIPGIVKEIPEARFLFCGTGPLERKMKKEIARLGLSSYVHFAEFVKNEDLSKYLNSADLYVSCSLSDGSSISLLEAMGCGLPVIVTDLPANSEWITDGRNGLVVPLRNSQVLAQKIVELLKDTARREQFGLRNLEIAREKIDWERNLGILEKIYEHLVG